LIGCGVGAVGFIVATPFDWGIVSENMTVISLYHSYRPNSIAIRLAVDRGRKIRIDA